MSRASNVLDSNRTAVNKAVKEKNKMTRSRNKRNRRFEYANQHASIQSRPNPAALVGGETFTARREDSLAANIYTDSKNATQFALNLGGVEVSLTGRQARTIQRLLNKHYSTCGSELSSEQPGLETAETFM